MTCKAKVAVCSEIQTKHLMHCEHRVIYIYTFIYLVVYKEIARL